MKDPRIKSSGMDVAQQFSSTPCAVNQGWEIAVGSTISDGSLNLSAEKEYALNDFWENGGSVRMRVKPKDTTGSFLRFFFMGIDTNFKMQLGVKGDTGGTILEIRNGSGSNYYAAAQTLIIGSWNELVLVWDPSAPSFTSYLDGGSAVTDASAGGAAWGAYDTEYGKLKVGAVSGGAAVTDMDTDLIEVSQTIFTADEVADLYNNTTYTEIDDSKAVVSLPLASNYSDGANEVTDNIGSGDAFLWGDGSTGSTQPTQLIPQGITGDGGDYLQAQSTTLGDVSTGDLTVMCVYATSNSATQRLFWKDDGSVGYRLYLISGKIAIFPRDGVDSLDLRTDDAIYQDGVLHHVAYVHDKTNDTAYIYVDGEQVKSGSISDIDTLTNSDTLTVGAESDGSAGVIGDLFKPRVFLSALTPTQIKEMARRDFKLINN